MLPIDLLVTCFYGVVNFFICLFTLHDSIYKQLDWLQDPVRAIEGFFIILVI
jgi:hypothetical protein